jgi:hypothetical protein
MDIAPISAIRPVTMIKPSTPAPDLSRVFEVEYLGQSPDDDYSPAGRKAARGLEDEEDEEAVESEPGSLDTEALALPVSGAKVSFFV